jgi:hypothetical protein
MRRESVIYITYKRKSLLCIAWRHPEGYQQTTGAVFESPSEFSLSVFYDSEFCWRWQVYFR